MCSKEQDLSNFYFRKDTNSYRNECKDCIRYKQTEAYRTNPVKYRKRQKRYFKEYLTKDPLYRAKNWLKNDYNLTIEEYNIQLEKQENVCYICKGLDKVRLAVDHCHSTGKLRGLLCSSCNQALGKLQDNPEIIQRAKEYIESNGIWFEEKILIKPNGRVKLKKCGKSFQDKVNDLTPEQRAELKKVSTR